MQPSFELRWDFAREVWPDIETGCVSKLVATLNLNGFPRTQTYHFKISKKVDFAGRWFWGTPISGKETRTFYDWKQLCNDKNAQIQWQQSKLPCMIHCESPQRSEKTTWTWRGKSRENHEKNKSADRPSVRFTNSKQLESNWNFLSSLMPPLKTFGCSTALGAKFISSNLQPTIQTVKQVIHWRWFACFWESYGWWKKSG